MQDTVAPVAYTTTDALHGLGDAPRPPMHAGRKRTKRVRGVVLALFALLIAGVLTPIALYAEVRRGERGSVTGTADAIVVLGAAILPNGTPTQAVRGRVRKAVELYRAGYAPVIVMTGGVGASGYSEAATMQALAVAQGVPESAVVIEGAATRTLESAEYVAALSREVRQAGQGGNWRRVIVVSDPFHLARSGRLFAAAGFDVQTAPADDWYYSSQSRRYYRVREVVALAVHGLSGEIPLVG